MSVINNHIVSKFDKTIGTGTTNQKEYPIYEFYDYGYFGQIYTALELGVGVPIWITRIDFHMVGDSVTDKSSINQTLKLGQCNQVEFKSNVRNNFTQNPFVDFSTSNITTVKSNFTWTVPEDYNDWLGVIFTTPFLYDPTDSNSNLIVIWENRDGSYISGSGTPYSEASTSGSLSRSYYDYADNNMPPTTDAGTADSTGRPNMKIFFAV